MQQGGGTSRTEATGQPAAAADADPTAELFPVESQTDDTARRQHEAEVLARPETKEFADSLRPTPLTEEELRDRAQRMQGIETVVTVPRAATVAALAAVDVVRAGTLDSEAQMAELTRICREWAA